MLAFILLDRVSGIKPSLTVITHLHKLAQLLHLHANFACQYLLSTLFIGFWPDKTLKFINKFYVEEVAVCDRYSLLIN
jgi:hypothetical protein